MFTADATVEHEGQKYTLTLAEQQACESPGDTWHGRGDPSTWLVVGVFRAARAKYGTAPRALWEALAARALGIPVEKLTQAIEWHVNYMRFHDADYSYDV
jgi:hypothetical protein